MQAVKVSCKLKGLFLLGEDTLLDGVAASIGLSSTELFILVESSKTFFCDFVTTLAVGIRDAFVVAEVSFLVAMVAVGLVATTGFEVTDLVVTVLVADSGALTVFDKSFVIDFVLDNFDVVEGIYIKFI